MADYNPRKGITGNEVRDVEYQLWWTEAEDPFPFNEEEWVLDDYFSDYDKALRRIEGYQADDVETGDIAKYVIRTKYMSYSYDIEVIE